MNVNTLMNQAQSIELSTFLENLKAQGVMTSTPILIGVSVSIFIGLLWCFFGLKLIRVWSAILGLALGFGIGAGAATAFHLDSTVVLIIGAVAGILLAILGAVFYAVGVFLVAWVVGSGVGLFLLKPQTLELALVCAGIGLVIALLTLKFAEPITMILTGIYGGGAAGTAIGMLLPFNGTWILMAVSAALAVLGIMVQFLMESGKRKRRHLERARRIREENSTANEVEKARAMMDELDSLPDPERPAEKKKGLREKRKERKTEKKQNKKQDKKPDKKADKKQNKKQSAKAGEEDITFLDLDD